MPFFQGAYNFQANNSVFAEVKGDQHITSPGANPYFNPSFLSQLPHNNQTVVHKSPAPELPTSEELFEEPEPEPTISSPPITTPPAPTPPAPTPSTQPAAGRPAQTPAVAAPTQPASQPDPLANNSLPPALSSAMAKKKEESKQAVPQTNGSTKVSAVVDASLGIAAFVLTQLQAAAAASPVPFISTAASIALNIVTNVQGARGNKGGFSQLAKEACDLVYVVIQIYEAQEKEGKEMPQDLNDDVGALVSTLTEIEEFSNKMASRRGIVGGIKRVLNNKDEAGQIQSYRQNIVSTLNIFWLKSSIKVRAQLKEISDKQSDFSKETRSKKAKRVPQPRKAPIPAPESDISLEQLAMLGSIDFRGTVWNLGGGGQANVMNIVNN